MNEFIMNLEKFKSFVRVLKEKIFIWLENNDRNFKLSTETTNRHLDC